MSCQSLAARAFAEPERDNMTHSAGFHRSVRFSSESRSSTRASTEQECKRETPGSISLTALTMTPVTSQTSAMSQSAPPASATFDLTDNPAPPPSCRFPKLEECAHFHYERVSLGGLSIETMPCEDSDPGEGWICLKVRSHVTSSDESARPLSTSWSASGDVSEWTLTRSRTHFRQLDTMLHRWLSLDTASSACWPASPGFTCSSAQAGVFVAGSHFSIAVLQHLTNDRCTVAYIHEADLYVVSAYFKYGEEIDPHIHHLERVFDALAGKRIIVGADANAHSPLWHSRPDQTTGRGRVADHRRSSVEDFILGHDLVVVNTPDQPATFSTANGESSVDITLSTRNVTVTDWKVHVGASTSDHRLITFRVGRSSARNITTERAEPGEEPPRFRDRGVNWDRFESAIHERMGYLDMREPASLVSRRFTNEIVRAAHQTLGIKRKSRDVGYEWWTPELDDLRKANGASRRAWQRLRKRGGRAEEIAREEFHASRARYRRRKEETELAFFRGLAESGNEDPWGLAYRVASGRKRPPSNVINGTKFAEGFAGTVDEAMHGLVYALCPDDDPSKDTEYHKQVRISAEMACVVRGTAWTLTRSRTHFRQLDTMLHRCIYDRKVSGLPNLSEELSSEDDEHYHRLIAHYAHHLSIIADDSLNCGPVLNWLQMDNKGHKLLVANEDSSSINTPAVAAAYSVRKYVSQARDEISFEVGDMISIIDMPGPQESLWWRGKRGFRVGFFPHHCVAVIGDKVPRHMTQPPPIVGSVAVAPVKPVLRKHGKLISLFRSFILSRPSRRSLKQQGILRERVFGCDLGEHLLNVGHDVPQVLVECARAIEARGAVDGVYRLSGGSGLTQRLRAAFDAGTAPELTAPAVARDPHAVPSLLKMYFRELPNPLCTYQLYESFVSAVQQPDEASKLRAVRDTVVKLPPPHYRTLAYLMRHLRRVSLLGESTGMTARNMAIVWAPNLLRSPRPQHALQGVAVQAVVTEFLICYAEDLFAQDQGADSSDSGPSSIEVDKNETIEAQVELRGLESGRRPKSLPLNPPTKLLSLEEARRRGNPAASLQSPQLPPASGAIAAAAHTQLRPSSHLRPKYIEVGSGPNNLPQYHTVLDLPIPGKRGVKRSPSGWRGLFSRSKQRPTVHAPLPPVTPPATTQEPTALAVNGLRPVKSCESLTSDTDTLAPLAVRPPAPLKQHTRSSSCDSYFEPWQAELAGMRLRLSPQERDLHMFSEEDDPQQRAQDGDSAASTPPSSLVCSASPSPQRHHNTDSRKRSLLEEQLSEIGYIDLESPRARAPAAEKRAPRPPSPPSPPPPRAERKRICKDRDNATPPLADTQTSLGNVKMRERASPRKAPPSARYSGLHQPLALPPRLSWPGKDHSTLIKVDWPPDSSSTNLTASTLNSSPATPLTPLYDPLESDSEVSETNKHTIKIESKECDNCDREKCLKCELKATDYSSEHSPLHSTDISYQNLNRLSAVSTSSNSEPSKKDASYENCDVMKVMTSSHESSSSYSNASLKQEDYETFNFTRPNYINLQSSSTSKSSPGSPLKSPLKSTISITFRSPTKSKTPDYEPIDNIDTPTNDRDSVYEDIDLEKNLSIVEEATVPETDASLPTQQACQPDFKDLIILETPTDQNDVYSQVKFFKKSIEEVNALIFESPEKEAEENAIMFEFPEEKRHYENVSFSGSVEKEYENINVDTLKICDKGLVEIDNGIKEEEKDNGNIIKVSNLNVRELANRFESPTEQKGPFTFEKFKAEIKYPSLERKEEDKKINVEVRKKDLTIKLPPPVSPKTYKLNKNSCNARSLDENEFVKEFGSEKSYVDRRKSLEVRDAKKSPKFLPDLNLNMEENTKIEPVTPTTENKISLVQRFNEKRPTELKNLINFDSDKKLSRERIEKYKEERRNFLREKYSSQSFRSSPEQLTRIKIKKDMDKIESCERLKEELPRFERRNTVDLGQRMRFSLARSTNNLDTINSPTSPDRIERREGESSKRESESAARREFDRKEKVSSSYHIRDMAALFEQKTGG